MCRLAILAADIILLSDYLIKCYSLMGRLTSLRRNCHGVGKMRNQRRVPIAAACFALVVAMPPIQVRALSPTLARGHKR